MGSVLDSGYADVTTVAANESEDGIMRGWTNSLASGPRALTLALLASTIGCAQLIESGTELLPARSVGAQGALLGRMAAHPGARNRPSTRTASSY